MTKILQVCNTDFYLNRFLKPLVLEIKSRGHHIECMCTGTKETQSLIDSGIIVHNFQFPNQLSPITFLTAIFRMWRFLKLNKFDLVNSHNRNSSIVTRIACYLANVPLNVYTAHGFYFHDNQSKISRVATEWLEWALAAITHYTLSQSNEDTEYCIKKNRLPKMGLFTIGNGINTKKFDPNQQPRKANTEFVVGAVGRLVHGKGFDDLILAFHKLVRTHANSRLMIIGGNIDQDLEPAAVKIKELIRRLDLESKISITGIVPDVEKYLSQCDVFVHPSYREGMPRSLLEAMCLGLPCIATRIRGAREIIEIGRTGFLYTPHHDLELYQLLNQIRLMPEELRISIGQRSREKVLNQYDETAYVKKQVDYLDQFIKKLTN